MDEAQKILKAGDETPSGHKVKVVLGQGIRGIVYTTENDGIRWHYYSEDGIIQDIHNKAIERFDYILSRIDSSMYKGHKYEARCQVGRALFSAFNSSDASHINDSFESVENFIIKKTKDKARMIYVLSSLITALVLITIGIIAIVNVNNPNIYVNLGLLGAMSGVCGACISVFQRVSIIDIDPLSDRQNMIIEGICRIMLGLFFGTFFVFAVYADLVIGIIKDNEFALIALAVVAGLSERYVPDLIQKLEAGTPQGHGGA